MTAVRSLSPSPPLMIVSVPAAPAARLMSYIDYCNQFWRSHLEYAFSPSAAMVYFKLLDLANSLRWKQSFAYSDPQLCAATGVSTNTLKAVRQQLADAGLIHFTPGGHGRGQAFKTLYSLLAAGEDAPQKGSVIPSKIDTITDPFPAPASPEKGQQKGQQNRQILTPYKEEDKTREETPHAGAGAGAQAGGRETAERLPAEPLPEPPPVPRLNPGFEYLHPDTLPADARLPFASDAFRAAWLTWRRHLHRKGKLYSHPDYEDNSLRKLAKMAAGDEATALAIINQSLTAPGRKGAGWDDFYPLSRANEPAAPAGPARPATSLTDHLLRPIE